MLALSQMRSVLSKLQILFGINIHNIHTLMVLSGPMVGGEHLYNYLGSVMLAAAISVPLTLLIACCLACRKCRKRGKGEIG